MQPIGTQLRILQWNTLAFSLAKKDNKGFPFVTDKALDPKLRAELQIKEVLRHNAHLVALQEVDQPALWVALEDHGYEVCYEKREDSPLGILMAFKKDTFSVCEKSFFRYAEDNHIGGILVLKYRLGERKVVFGTTHLSSGEKRCDDRYDQFEDFAARMLNMRTEFKCEHGSLAHGVVAADFNTHKEDDFLDDYDESEYVSAYPKKMHTTFKKRISDDHKSYCVANTEDYIYTTGKTLAILPLDQTLEEPFLPNEDFPSDHWVLVADVVF